MQLNIKKEISEDVITSSITVGSLGNSTTTADLELEMLHDFVKYVKLSDIDFKGNIKIENGVPVLTSDAVDGTTVVELVIDNLIDKKYIIDENLSIEFKQDVRKVPLANLNDVLDSQELYAQATSVLFIEKVKAAITEKLAEIRGLSNDFEGETEVIL